MAFPAALGKRVTAHREDEDLLEDDLSRSEDLSSSSEQGGGSTNEDDGTESEDSEMSEPSGDNDIQSSLSQISFGALAKAQQSLGSIKRASKRKYEGHDEEDDEKQDANTKSKRSKSEVLNELREKIRKAKEEKASKAGLSKDESNPGTKKKRVESRVSKHAPAVQSSKFAVSRRRVVVDGENVAQVKSRDPRFDSAVHSHSHNHKAGYATASQPDPTVTKNYAFLNEYRDFELQELNEQLRRTKNEDEKSRLKKTITSMSDRKRAYENRDREREVLSKHRKKERELIKEGKKEKAWFLKKADLKQAVLKEKYEGMGAKERQKGIERRRKKIASKEKKEMPRSRRVVDS